MSNSKLLKTFIRRRLMQLGLISGAGIVDVSVGIPLLTPRQMIQAVTVPPMNIPPNEEAANPPAVLREFDRGTVTQENGRTVREFRVEARTFELQLNGSTSFIIWNLNERVPGPTFRALTRPHRCSTTHCPNKFCLTSQE